MRWLIKQGPPLGCAFGRDSFQLAGRPAEGGELRLHEGRLTLDSTTRVIDIESSSAAVKEALHAAGLSSGKAFFPVPKPSAILSIPNHLLIFRTIRLAPMPEAELLSATHWKIADEAGLDPQESTSQVVTAWQVEESGKQKTEVLAVACKNQDLQPYIDIAENAGLAVSAIDLASSAICRSLWRTSAPGNATPGHEDRLLLVLEEDFAALTIASGPQIRYMRILQAGLARLQQLMSQLTGVSPDEVRPAAAKELASATPPKGPGKPTAADFLTQAQTIYCRELSREISLAVRYYEETIRAGAPDRGVIVAAAGFPASAAASLSNLTSINFQAADAPPEAPPAPAPGSSASNPGSSSWHVAIGLCFYHQDGADSSHTGASTDREAA